MLPGVVVHAARSLVGDVAGMLRDIRFVPTTTARSGAAVAVDGTNG